MTPPSAVLSTASLLAAALLLAGCGSAPSQPGRVPASSTAGASPSWSSSPTASVVPDVAQPVPPVPAARGPVTGRGLVLQRGDEPAQLCLGPVAESFPPACDGLPLVGWSWDDVALQDSTPWGGALVRSGSYDVTGRFDGRALTVTGAAPVRPGDDQVEPSPRPSAPPRLDAVQWDGVDRALAVTPGLVMRGREGDGPMLVTVVFDDGTIQAWADASFGAGVVLVTSALR